MSINLALYQRIISQTNGISPWTCHPLGDSFNDGTPLDLFNLFYVTVDHVILSIMQSGRGKTLMKADIKGVFWLLPVHPADRHLNCNNNIYINHCIPFSLQSAAKLFNILADLLSWITQNVGCLTSFIT